jgi:hypothetical protein
MLNSMSTKRKASVKTLIKEAELTTASRDFVHHFYFEQSKLDKDSQSEDVDEFTEQRLLDKNDEFIDLTLAQYCFHPETLSKLFKKSKDHSNVSLVLACVSNVSVGRRRYAFVEQPEALFYNSRKGQIDAWFKVITSEEIDALFRNPTLGDGFLTNVLEGKQFWSEMTDEQKSTVLRALYYNPRVVTGYDNQMMDGYAEYSYGRVPDAIWRLAERLPVERKWAAPLEALLEKVVGDCRSMDMLEVAKRWNVVDEKENPDRKKQLLNPFEAVRFALFKKSRKINEPYGKDRAGVRKQYLDNADVAFRAAVYSQLLLTPDEIKGAYEKDALVAVEYIGRNLHIWRNEPSRQALHDICWDADGRYNDNYLDCANQFNWKKRELEKEYPQWFEEKEPEDLEIDETKQMLSVSLAKELMSDSKTNPALQYLELIHTLVLNASKQMRTLNWIFWGLVALIVLQFVKR